MDPSTSILRKRKLGLHYEDDMPTMNHMYKKIIYKHQDNNTNNIYSKHFLSVVLISFVTRLIYINSSPIVVWDEAHFGKFANWYLTKTFYFDVHPPLGKLLIAFSGWLFNYDGSFPFESGSTYKDVPILQMRIFCAIFGATVAPFIYGTCRNLRYTRNISAAIAFMSVFDNALLTISKFVLLDPILLSFTSMSVYTITRFEREDKTPFTLTWFKWLFLTGASLGLVTSVKWVGLFTYAFVGCFILRQLWKMLPTIKKEPKKYMQHFVFRAAFLIVLPVSIYMTTFYIHFLVLRKTGSGDSHMSSRFQSNLIGSKISTGADHVLIGESIVTLRNRGFGGGLLHSHPQAYPTGSKQGQVTLYHHRDDNNHWKILFPWKSGDNQDTKLKNNREIRLFHVNGKRNLHSHSIPAPISVYQNEVSVYGNLTLGDSKDHWIVEMDSSDQITRLSSVFRLKHKDLGCYLGSSGERLPEWGFTQLEVVCTDHISKRIDWNIEEIVTKENETTTTPRKSNHYDTRHFIEDFVDLNVAMWYGNNALTPKIGKKDLLISQPSQWPLLDVGLRMCNWNVDTIKFYLLGNPIIWWTTSLSIVFFIMESIYTILKWKIDGFVSWSEENYLNNGWMLVLGWALHYIPFFIMGRVTYLHHYFPSLVMSTMMIGHIMQKRQISMLPKICIVVTAVFFVFFAPLSYGFTGEAQAMASRRWLKAWNMS